MSVSYWCSTKRSKGQQVTARAVNFYFFSPGGSPHSASEVNFQNKHFYGDMRSLVCDQAEGEQTNKLRETCRAAAVVLVAALVFLDNSRYP